MANEEITITVLLVVVLTCIFYYDEIKQPPKVIEIESRIDYFLDKIKSKMGNETDLIAQMIQRLDSRDERFEQKLDKIAENQNKQQIEIVEIKGEIKIMQQDIRYLKGKKNWKPPNTPTNFATVTDEGFRITVNWKLLKSAGFGSLSAGGLYGAWLLIKQYFLH